MPPRDVTGSRVVNRKPPRRTTKPAAVFGPIRRADQGIRTAQRQAHQRVQRAQRPILKRTNVPYVPKLAHPTQTQRAAGVSQVVHGLAKQGVTRQEVRALSRGAGGRERQQRVNRYLGATRTQQKRVQARVGALAGAQGTQHQMAQVGREISRNILAQATPYKDSHHRAGIGPATVDLTAASNAIGSRLANNPASAFVKGLSALAEVRPLSDKSLAGRTLNDLVTYPAAAIPTIYHGVTEPKATAKAIIEQVAHPIATTKEHPLFGALLLHGGISAAGRGAGAVARSGALGAGAREAAGLVRPSLGLAGTQGSRLTLTREYNKSLPHKALQVAADKRRVRVGTERIGDRQVSVLATREREQSRLLNKRTDFQVSRANAMERAAREQEATAARETFPARGRLGHAAPTRLRPERDVVAMAMEGTLRGPETFKEDLLKERQRLDAAYREHRLDPAQKRTNRVRARSIDRVLKSKGALRNAQAVFDSARTLAVRGNALSDEAVSLGMLSPEASTRAKLFPYAQSHMGAKPVEHSDGTVSLRAGDGTFLSDEQIHAHMVDPATGPVVNPEHISYLPHRTDVRGARAFHAQFRPGQRKNLDLQHRSGTAYEMGATAADAELPVEHLVRQRNLIANVREHDKLIRDAGIKHPEGRYFTWDEAQAYAKRANRATNEATNEKLPGEPDLVPVRALPAKYDEARKQQIQEELQDPTVGTSKTLEDSFRDRLKAPSAKDRQAKNVVLMPANVVSRMQEHLVPSTPGAKKFQAATSAFRSTVLPFSTKWLTGNLVEAVGRLAITGATPRDVHVGRKFIKELTEIDKTAGEQVQSHLIGGLLYGERGLTNRRTAADVSRTAGAAARLPVVKELGKGYRAITGGIFALNRAMEQTAQTAALGKYARKEVQAFTGSWTKAVSAQKEALREVAKGHVNTAKQQQAARFIDETLGQYSRFSPTTRHIIQTYAPFLPWYLNSVRFVYWTLPMKHPIKTAVLTQAEAAFQKDWEDQHKGVPPGLKPSVPSGGGFVDVGRYTPFGYPGPVMAGEVGEIPSFVLPQVSGPIHALEGNDPFGRPLKVPKTASNPKGEAKPGQRVLAAVNQGVEAMVPFVSLVRRAREQGRAPYATSTALVPQTKEPKAGVPETSAANRVLNPFRPVYISKGREGGGNLTPTQKAVLKAYERSQGGRIGGGMTPEQKAVLKAYERAHR